MIAAFFDTINMTKQVEEQRTANFGVRVAASILDSIILSPILFLITKNSMEYRSFELFLVLISLYSFYKPLMEYRFGGTLGKMIMKIKVVDKDNNKMTLNQSFIRWLHYFPNFIFTITGTYKLYTLLGNMQFESIPEFLDWQIQNSNPSVLESYAPVLIVFFAAFVLTDRVNKRGLHDVIAKTYVIHKS